ncbi:M48 family metallopeptidase [Leptolyngbya ohadii]|uniref:M48 family metallopeptidase n=1 Tax=Leptolyngbya ohadii TaxID=1962290 RepID=UPI0019D4EA89|nr:M48 family metallopeptidase [Leptolyngbya ohadii]
MTIELPPGMADYSENSPPPQNRQIVLLLGFFAGLAIAFLLSIDLMIGVLVGWIPPQVEQQLGALIVPSFEQQAKPSATQDSLNQLLDRLKPHLPAEQQRNYRVLYIPDSTVNALAIPGDRIILYKGLIDQAESENELMMVLGHELGHFAHRDHLRQLGRGLLWQIAISSFFGDLNGLQSIALSATQMLSNSSFSQTQEYRADEMGITLLQKTYGQVAGATDFFARLSEKENFAIDFLTTHPNPDQRVRRLEQIIQKNGWKVGERFPFRDNTK